MSTYDKKCAKCNNNIEYTDLIEPLDICDNCYALEDIEAIVTRTPEEAPDPPRQVIGDTIRIRAPRRTARTINPPLPQWWNAPTGYDANLYGTNTTYTVTTTYNAVAANAPWQQINIPVIDTEDTPF